MCPPAMKARGVFFSLPPKSPAAFTGRVEVAGCLRPPSPAWNKSGFQLVPWLLPTPLSEGMALKESQGWRGAWGSRCRGCRDPQGQRDGRPWAGNLGTHRGASQSPPARAGCCHGSSSQLGRGRQLQPGGSSRNFVWLLGEAAVKGDGDGVRGVPQEGRGSLRGLLTKAPASVAESWES